MMTIPVPKIESHGRSTATLANRKAYEAPLARQPPSTPGVVVEALLYGLRNGLSYLGDPNGRRLLKQCDPDAIHQVAQRLRGWGARNVSYLPPYSDEKITSLLKVWHALRSANT
jgi:hypothetical protein